LCRASKFYRHIGPSIYMNAAQSAIITRLCQQLVPRRSLFNVYWRIQGHYS